MAHWTKRAAALALVAGAIACCTGCSPGPSVEAVWAMPTVATSDADPAAARAASRGYHFTKGQPPGRGGDKMAKIQDGPRGDLPEGMLSREVDIWRIDERQAMSEARDLGRGMVIDFWAEWCEACRRFERETFGDPDVRQAISAGYVALRVDVTEETFENREQQQRYSVVSLPTVLVLDAHGRERQRIDAFVDSATFLARLDAASSR